MLARERKIEVAVVDGDIATIEADALITAINSSGAWFGGIDGVIMRCAGLVFHEQASKAKLVDGRAIVVRSDTPHKGKFGDVVFVVDDLRLPLSDIVAAGLKAADKAGFKSVTLPAIRMGVAIGEVEKSAKEVVEEIVIGVNNVIEGFRNLESVTFVVFNDPQIETLLAAEFVAQHNSLGPRVIVYLWLV